MIHLLWGMGALLLLALLVLEGLFGLTLVRRWSTGAMAFIFSHLPVLLFCFRTILKESRALPFFAVLLPLEAGLWQGAFWLRLNIRPMKTVPETGLRLRVLIGGRRLCRLSVLLALSPLFYLALPGLIRRFSLPAWVWIADISVCVLSAACLYLNGMLRILFSSRWLNVLRRLILILLMLIPVVHFAALGYACYTAKNEYEYGCFKALSPEPEPLSESCATRYPLLLLHGVGFRDMRYFNYWGRIPKELIKRGAKVYYGHQEAWGTIEFNAGQVKERIARILEETGCEKVNIIAHSKGGLDARYLISSLGCGEQVASLTAVSTPHRGCRMVDLLLKMSDGLYRLIAGCIDRCFGRMGDQNPDAARAARQFSTESCRRFNRENPDCPGVYYQSFASVMHGALSDFILTVPYLVTRALEGPNDGLVSAESARWGNFRGTFESGGWRGISHGDMIDLRRDDYKGFDVRKTYVQIVEELKKMGF